MVNLKKDNRGITLIALVITIIVLLILAGISIATLTGDNGLLTKASDAKIETVNANVFEKLQIEELAYLTDKSTLKETSTLIEYLQSKDIIEDEIGGEGSGKWQINVTALLGTRQSLGNGDATVELKDVYMLEKQSVPSGSIVNTKLASTTPIKIAATTTQITYKVVYYGNGTSETLTLGNLTDDNDSSSTPVASTDESEKIYNAVKDKTLQEIVAGVNIDGITTNFMGASGTDAIVEYNNQVYVVSLNLSDRIVSTVAKANADLTKFGIQEIAGNNYLITPSTSDHLIHGNYKGPKTFSDMYYYDESTGELDTTRPFTNGYVAHDSDGYDRYYDTSGALVLVIPGK